MSFLINHQTESSFTTTTQTSNNNQYPIAIANRISNLLKIDTKKMNQQPIEIKQTYTPTKINQDIDITPTKATTTISMTPISDK